MISKDHLLKSVDTKKQIRVTVANTRTLVDEAHRRHNTSATASAALGRVLTAALMMGSDLKAEQDTLTLKVDGKGPAGAIIATVDSKGTGRAMITNPVADLPSRAPGKLDVGGIVGTDGFVEVIKDLGLKQPFSGRVELVSGEIAEDLAQYFLQSEQIPSLVSLGVLVDTDLSIKAAGGIFVQAMPGADDTLLEKVENNITSMGAISAVLAENNSLETILEKAMYGIPYEIIDKRDLAFRCRCSRERLANMLTKFSDEELESIYNEQGILEITCNFCNETYRYHRGEMEGLKNVKSPS